MLKRLTALILLLVLGGSAVLNGAQSHSGHECGMAGMDGMDCCQKAQSQENTPEVLAARLCCAFQCQEPGSTAPTSAETLRGPQASPLVTQPAEQAATAAYTRRDLDAMRPGPSSSPPAYISHHSLLI